LARIPILQLHLGLAKVDAQAIPLQRSPAVQQLHLHLALGFEEALFRQPLQPLCLQAQVVPLRFHLHLARQFQPPLAGVGGSPLGPDANGAILCVEKLSLDRLQMGGSQLHGSGAIFWGGLVFGQASLEAPEQATIGFGLGEGDVFVDQLGGGDGCGRSLGIPGRGWLRPTTGSAQQGQNH
jgi:hypothetical protein